MVLEKHFANPSGSLSPTTGRWIPHLSHLPGESWFSPQPKNWSTRDSWLRNIHSNKKNVQYDTIVYQRIMQTLQWGIWRFAIELAKLMFPSRCSVSWEIFAEDLIFGRNFRDYFKNLNDDSFEFFIEVIFREFGKHRRLHTSAEYGTIQIF